MKKVHFFGPFGFTILFCGVRGLYSLSAEETNWSAYRLSHDQYMVTYVGARNGDVVGVFDPWYPTQDLTNGSFSYTFIDSKNGTYEITISTGLVTIANNSGLKAGTDKLKVRTTLNGLSEDHYIFVTVKATSDCYFIDPSVATNGNGTRDYPFNAWASAKFTAGKAFFQKRGTTSTSQIFVTANGKPGSEIIIGSYGTGARAYISTGLTTVAISLRGHYIQFYELSFFNSKYGIETEKGLNGAYQHCLFTDLTFDSNGPNGQLYVKRQGEPVDNVFYHKIYDIVANNGAEHGIKLEAGYCHVENFRATGNVAQGISIPIWGDYDTLSGISCYNNGHNGVELSGRRHELSYSLMRNEYRGVVVDDPNSDGTRIHHCLIIGSRGEHGIFLRCARDQGAVSIGRNFIIEDNEIKNITKTGVAGIAIGFGVDNVIIRRNIIHDNSVGIIIGQSATSIDSVYIQNNILYSNYRQDIFGYAGDKIWITHNTCTGDINLSGTTTEVVRNNYFSNLSSAEKSGKNIDIDTISTSRHFVNFAAHDYHLKSTAISAIDKGSTEGTGFDYNGELLIGLPDMGISVGQPKDFDQKAMINKPDIGCYEYIPPEESADVKEEPPAKLFLPDATFYIKDDLQQNAVIGTMHADPVNEDPVSYSISGGNINQLARIDPASGELLVNNASQLFLYDSLQLTVIAGIDYSLSNDTALCILKISHPEPEPEKTVNHSPVVSEQTFAIREENVSDNFLIGTVKAYDIDNDQTLLFKIVSGNDNDLFSIDKQSGNLYLAEASSIDFSVQQQKVLIISVTDNATEPATSNTSVQINFVPMIKVFYIDPTVKNSTFQNGSEMNPYNSWKDVPWMEGGIYKQKSGTVADEGKINVYASNVLITSYGEGDEPVINSSTRDFAIRVYEKTNITISGLHVTAYNAISCIYIFGSSCDNNIIEHCILEGSVNGVRVIDGKNVIIRYNTFIGASEAIYSFAENTEIYYNVFRENNTAVSVRSLYANCEIYNNIFYNNSTSISVSYSRLTVYNNIFYLDKPNAVAINKQKGNVVSDYNLYYPEKAGFYIVADKTFNSLDQLQNAQGFDLHSLRNDPAFQDVFNNNFKPAEGSPVINAGKFVGLSYDFAGTNISDGGIPDLGIFEFNLQNATAINTWSADGAENEDIVRVFPNPSDGIVNICFHSFDDNVCRLTVSNIAGRVFSSDEVSNIFSGLTLTYDLSAYEPGIYFVACEKQNNSQNEVQKLIIR